MEPKDKDQYNRFQRIISFLHPKIQIMKLKQESEFLFSELKNEPSKRANTQNGKQAGFISKLSAWKLRGGDMPEKEGLGAV